MITNQPVIARGELSVEELGEIHNKMETLLGQKEHILMVFFIAPIIQIKDMKVK